MANLRRKLPPLTALTAFEAVARLASFTRAAEELGVTQAAVSRQIHLLEQTFGYPLFRRLHRRIEPTENGRLLASTTTTAFNLIAETIADLSKEEAEDELAISATMAFSQFWLLPRISSFSKAHPNLKLRIVTQDNVINVDSGEVDLAIRFGSGFWPNGHVELLFNDEIFPICSPEYAEEIGELHDPAELTRYPLISNDTTDPTWTGWTEWLAAFSVAAPARPSGMRCSFYTEAIYAALNGHGIALGWRRLVEDLLAQRRLVRMTDKAIVTRNAYFLILPRRRARKTSVDLLIEWLKDEASTLQIP
ncbi:LysR substrate-binding domain-containing protein [Labrys wisconsinensis]|uniref:DNA-binding transcriptional LysR family regulator n=1 Tax=Labrys wisconsinensis TaxID=425677 RepID=A0ABU0JH21_9HYPH|nr:LysR substrate-binding domain-containing protein [Labrys wisconsinensis]MDQ0473583.1 DNA-binding transcriptional LysR family regulator [Labrys wisconsinensis]